MLGRTAGGLFWMSRYLERSENTARLVDAGFHLALTRPSEAAPDEWASVLSTSGADDAYKERYDDYEGLHVVDFLLRDTTNPGSVLSMVHQARENARQVRTALTREAFEATNEAWMTLRDLLAKPVSERDLPSALNMIRQQSALVRGAIHETMLRNDVYNFLRIGTFLERADNTARILDVKYYVLLPSIAHVGAALDNVQWEKILRAVSAHRAYRWLNGEGVNARDISEFLIPDRQFPRSLAFSVAKVTENLNHLARDYGDRPESLVHAESMSAMFDRQTIAAITDVGLHEFLREFIRDHYGLAGTIASDYRFNE